MLNIVHEYDVKPKIRVSRHYMDEGGFTKKIDIDIFDDISKNNLTNIKKILAKNINIDIVSIMENVPIGWTSDVQDSCGTYIITTQSGKIYVGSSKRVRNRILTHMYNNVSITEPIESVSFYITKDHIDARILEYILIKELKPELNMDVLDKRDYVTSYYEKLLLSNPNLLLLFEELRYYICSLADIQEHIRRGLIIYQAKMESFCAIKIKKDCMIIYLKIDETRFDDSHQLCSKIGHAWTYNRYIELDNIYGIDKIFTFVRQAYESTIKNTN